MGAEVLGFRSLVPLAAVLVAMIIDLLDQCLSQVNGFDQA
jgi:hypothetical protein